MKRMIPLFLCVLLMPCLAVAQNSGPSIGLVVGSPTGFAFKNVFTRSAAIDIKAGWSLTENGKLHVTGDYQFLFPQTMSWTDDYDGRQHEVQGLTPYFGIGGRFLIRDNEHDDAEFNVGVRLGGGVEYAINRFALFLEIYPVVNIVPSTDFDFDGGFGFRFYFSRHR